jgi:hypothetical protein
VLHAGLLQCGMTRTSSGQSASRWTTQFQQRPTRTSGVQCLHGHRHVQSGACYACSAQKTVRAMIVCICSNLSALRRARRGRLHTSSRGVMQHVCPDTTLTAPHTFTCCMFATAPLQQGPVPEVFCLCSGGALQRMHETHACGTRMPHMHAAHACGKRIGTCRASCWLHLESRGGMRCECICRGLQWVVIEGRCILCSRWERH